jgi:ElaB/YqjD/DUF883 family membrane-anchored ribosome-binding protein
MPIRGKPASAKAKRGAAKQADEYVGLETIDYLKQSLTDMERMSSSAESVGSWQAAYGAKRQAVEIREKLDAAIAKASRPDETMTDEQLLAAITSAIGSLPQQHLDAVRWALDMREHGPRLEVVEGGG